jgi:hypothetical protein
MKAMMLFPTIILAMTPNTLAAYGRRPIEAILRDERVGIIDATVEGFTSKGFAKIRTNQILKGKTSPKILKGFFMSAGPTLRDSLKKGKRYVFVLKGEEVYEPCTFWEILQSFDGELMCYYYRYEPAPGLKDDNLPVLASSGLYSLADFRRLMERVIGKRESRKR